MEPADIPAPAGIPYGSLPPSFFSHGSRRINIMLSAILALSIILVLSIGWVGHIGSDDLEYIAAARNWFSVDSYLPETHWAMRLPLVLPMGLAFLMFGRGEIISILPSLLYAAGILGILLFNRHTPLLARLLASLVFVMTPLFAEMATIANVDIAEAFFVFASFLIFCGAYGGKAPLQVLFISGVLAGIAFTARETSGALLVFYGLLFLFRPGMARWRYFVMGAGFWLVIGCEMAYYAAAADAPLHRFEVALGTIDEGAPTDPGTGNITTSRWLGPIASVLVNNEFGLLFWLAPAVFWLGLYKAPWLMGSQRCFLALLLTMAGVWFIVTGYCLDLRALPRYYVVPAIVMCIMSGYGLYGLWLHGRIKTAAILFLLFATASISLIDLSNQQIILPEKTAVSLLRDGEIAVLHTDPHIADRSGQLLEWSGVAPDRLSHTIPQPGDYFLYSASSAAGRRGRREDGFDPASFTPQESWQIIKTIRGSPTLIGRALNLVGLDRYVEEKGLGRLIWESPPVVLYRIG